MTTITELHQSHDRAIPVADRIAATYGSQQAWAIAQTEELIKFSRRRVNEALVRVRRLNGKLADPTLPTNEVERLNDYRGRAVTEIGEARREHGRFCAHLTKLRG